MELRFHYQVVNLATIKGMLYVVPDQAQADGYFHASAFKWVRQMPGIGKGRSNNVSYDSDDSGDDN